MDEIANFSRLHSLSISKRDLSTYNTKSNIEKMSRESLGLMLEFYISNVGYCFVRDELRFIIFLAFLVDSKSRF